MASKLEFVEYICDQLSSTGNITYKKMFGEYGLYLNGKIFALICDNMLYIKVTEAGKEYMPTLETAPPYSGAKPYFIIEDIDNKEALCTLILKTYQGLPEPKVKKGK